MTNAAPKADARSRYLVVEGPRVARVMPRRCTVGLSELTGVVVAGRLLEDHVLAVEHVDDGDRADAGEPRDGHQRSPTVIVVPTNRAGLGHGGVRREHDLKTAWSKPSSIYAIEVRARSAERDPSRWPRGAAVNVVAFGARPDDGRRSRRCRSRQ